MVNNRIIWKRPLQIFVYFIYELQYQVKTFVNYAKLNIQLSLTVVLLTFIFVFIMFTNIPGKPFLLIQLQKDIQLSLYWIGLGILSSVGLGSGLHTFILYLGPHIARVTLAAYECGSLEFPEPPYPDTILCPPSEHNGQRQSIITNSISMYAILSKIRMEAFMWGFGTAIGELPPYFMARFARLSRDNSLKLSMLSSPPTESKSDEFLKKDEDRANNFGFIKLFCVKAEHCIRLIISKVGFWGILICASIPNPLFDIAGLTCGHFLVPFWTFFGATFIGKAIFKMHLQVLVVIALFSKDHMNTLTKFASRIWIIGGRLHDILVEYMKSQRLQLYDSPAAASLNRSWLHILLEWIVIGMVLYFLLSIIISMSDQYRARRGGRSSDSLINV